MFLHDVLEMNASRTPEHIAVIANGVPITYAEQRSRVRALAGALPTIADRGDRVAILAQNVREYVDVLYAVPAAGMILTLLNQRLHPSEWAAIGRDAGLRVAFVHADYYEAFHAVSDGIPTLETIVVIGDGGPTDGLGNDDLMARGSASDELAVDPSATDEDVAWIVYTSGSTGTPKGVTLCHRGLLSAGVSIMLEYGTRLRERALFVMPLCHAGASSVMTTHVQGGTFVLEPGFEPRAWLQAIEQYQINSTTLVPTMINMVLSHPDIDQFDLSSLVHFGYGGSVMPIELLRATIDRFGSVLASGLGMSEAPGPVTSLNKNHHARALAGEEHLLTSVGTNTALINSRVVDDDNVECPPGVVGEIVLKGDLLFKGYWNNPEVTEASFRDGWFRTGDMASRDEEGFFFLVDRRKDMIITGGENVYSAEVERAIYECPQVSEVAVIGVPHPTWVETVAAMVVLREPGSMTEDDVIEWCRARLAKYKCPRYVELRTELPKSTIGKILKHQLRQEWAARSTTS